MRKIAPLAACLLLAACSKNIQNTEAIRLSVMDYLTARAAQTGLDPNAMQMEITAVTYQKDEAHATVYFRPKGVDSGGMAMNYSFDRKGDKWVVRPPQANSANPHATQAPPPNPDMPRAEDLPPGHPPTGAKP